MDSYFPTYEDLQIQHLMLTDKVRVETYREAIFSNKSLFEGKVVLDVGAGTGILSVLCGLAGARQVYAVEAASKLIPIIEATVAENKLNDKVTIINSRIEDVEKGPCPDLKKSIIPEPVDIIISEWMGFFLLHEGMLNSVLSARDKFLKAEGVMFPEECEIYASLCELPQHHDLYDNFHGLSMKSFGKMFRSSLQSEPQVLVVEEEWVLSKPVLVKSFKLSEVSEENLKLFTSRVVACAEREGKYQGLCLYFNVSFPSVDGSKIVLSTSPSLPPTHWKQTVIVFLEGIELEESEPVAFELMFRQHEERKYEITYTPLEPEELSHPTPCDCYQMKCQVIKAFLQTQSSQTS